MSKICSYLIDPHTLTPDMWAAVEELLAVNCLQFVPLAKSPSVYLAHTTCTAEEFSLLPFPDGCTVTDVTGQDLKIYF